ncbi:hypothetical protein Salat_1872700 [Sesamum alatum]|uniref:Uncharacterized protein n=1 Tax=Sesamum alatum TaxID=300844 RepID=A0AAE2CI00_9LAMI|nr:hypothetical protein Salat_1872700 [Sesamum alatum]
MTWNERENIFTFKVLTWLKSWEISKTTVRRIILDDQGEYSSAESARRQKGLYSNVQSDSGFDNVFREVAGVTIAIFKSILVCLSSPTAQSSGWSLVSRLMLAKPVAENDVVNEVGGADFALSSLQRKLRSNGAKAVEVQNMLQTFDAIVEGFKGGIWNTFFLLFLTWRLTPPLFLFIEST